MGHQSSEGNSNRRSSQRGGNQGRRQNQNRNRNRRKGPNRSGGKNQNPNRRPHGKSKRPNQKKPAPAPQKTGIGSKILAFFGLGKKKASPPPKGNKRTSSTQSKRPARRREPRISEPTSGRLHIGNLSYQATDEELKTIFGSHGTVVSAEIITNPHNGRSKGFGFVEMANVEEAKKALAALQGHALKGREITVSGAHSDGRKKSDRKPDSRRESTARSENRGDRNTPRDRGRRERPERGQNRREQNRSGRRGKQRPDAAPIPERKVETIHSPALRVENVNSEALDEDLSLIFAGIAEVKEASWITDGTEGNGSKAARVEFPSVEEAQKAINVLHGKKFMGQALTLTGKGVDSPQSS